MNRLFYVYKMQSSTLAENDYNYNVSFMQAKKNSQIVSIGDSQMLRSIRDIKGTVYDKEELELLFNRRNEFMKKQRDSKYTSSITELNRKIHEILFVPEYLSVLIEQKKHYKHIIKNGVVLNGKKYKRFLCSPSQARVSTIIMVSEDIYDELYERISNGRKVLPMNASKENAYFGLASSATKVVTEPRVLVIDDYLETRKVYCNWVVQTDKELEDSSIEQKWVDFEFNSFDGMGLISPEFAKQWAKDLDLKYVPAEFCIRHSFLKGMVCQFDFVDFCAKKNNGNYMLTSLYGDEVDIREVDVIITKSQFKMWNCYDSYEQYNENCHKNNLVWGVSQYTKEYPKDILRLNYQSIQTLLLEDEDIEELCQQTIDYFRGVTLDNIYYTILCMLGINIDDNVIKKFMAHSDSHWLKALIYNNDLIQDRYIANKIFDNISTKLKNTYLGEIYVDGNYQVMVSDPYAFMEHACGLPVIGLLQEGEHYSQYWNNKDVTTADAMRSPLTYRSEHNVLHFQDTEDTRYWFKYLTCGIVYNVHGNDVILHADSDFDFDLVATTSNEVMLRGIDHTALPVAYEKGSAGKGLNTLEDLCKADMLAFGSKIGQITNKGSSIFAMLPLYDENSEEYAELEKRLILIRVAQGQEIDKAKGVSVFDFPKHWTSYNSVKSDDSEQISDKKRFFNNILIERKPYFFIHRYASERREYKNYCTGRDIYCQVMFNTPLSELLVREDLSEAEAAFVRSFYRFCPIVDTGCVMNRLSKYMSSFKFNLRKEIIDTFDDDIYLNYLSGKTKIDQKIYKKAMQIVKDYFTHVHEEKTIVYDTNAEDEEYPVNYYFDKLKEDINKLFRGDIVAATDYLVHIFYVDLKSKNKCTLWNLCGEQICSNVSACMSEYDFPMVSKSDNGFEYLGKRFTVQTMPIEEDEEEEYEDDEI